MLRTAASIARIVDWQRVSIWHSRTQTSIQEDTDLVEFGAQQQDVFHVEILPEEEEESADAASNQAASEEECSAEAAPAHPWLGTQSKSVDETQEVQFELTLPLHIRGERKIGDFLKLKVPLKQYAKRSGNRCRNADGQTMWSC